MNKLLNRRYLIIALSLLLIGSIFYYLGNIISYILVAWIISMLGEPIMRFLSKIKIGKKGFGESTKAILTIFTFIIIFSLVILLLIPPVVHQAGNLAQVDVKSIETTLRVPLLQLTSWFNEHGFPLTIDSLSLQFQNFVKSNLKVADVASVLGSIVNFAGNFIIAFASISFISYFFLKESGMFINGLLAFTPNHLENNIKHIIDDVETLLRRYFGAILIQMLLFSSFNFILLLLFGVKNALLISVFAGLLNVIPYVGPLIGLSLGLFITLSSYINVDFYVVLLPVFGKVALSFFITQQIDGYFIVPNVFGNSVKAHPLEIFLVILIGAKISGITGMVLAIPVYTIIRVLARAFFLEFKVVQKLTESIEDI